MTRPLSRGLAHFNTIPMNPKTPEQLFTPELTDWIRNNIPLLQNMQVRFDRFENGLLEISCPLEPNINDKGTAFGGSMAALATVCGWLYTTLHARTISSGCEAVIANSRMTYHAPAHGAFSTQCQAAVPETFFDRLRQNRRAKLELNIDLLSDNNEKVASYSGLYVALPKSP